MRRKPALCSTPAWVSALPSSCLAPPSFPSIKESSSEWAPQVTLVMSSLH